MGLFTSSTPLRSSCTAARGPFARDSGIHRLGPPPGAELPSPRTGLLQQRIGALCPVAAPRPLYSPAAPPPCGSLGTPRSALVPGTGLRLHLAVRALEHDPPFRRQVQLWLRACAALGDTCTEQTSVLLFLENPSPKVHSNVFPKWLFFFTY